ncbi:MAG: hypothetical protein ACOZAR_03385 [Patescibacteria group bacterium]
MDFYQIVSLLLMFLFVYILALKAYLLINSWKNNNCKQYGIIGFVILFEVLIANFVIFDPKNFILDSSSVYFSYCQFRNYIIAFYLLIGVDVLMNIGCFFIGLYFLAKKKLKLLFLMVPFLSILFFVVIFFFFPSIYVLLKNIGVLIIDNFYQCKVKFVI